MRVSTISKSLEDMNRCFSAISDTPTLDAQILIAHVINKPRSWVLAFPEYELSSTQLITLNNAILKLETGTQLPYILGYWEFYGRKFFITPDVLIPRPETELLVEKAMEWLNDRSKTPNNNLLAADIGCGSGCIGISLAINQPTLHMVASDISLAALRVASTNAIFHSISTRFQFIQCDLIPPISQKFHLICANLPYIPSPTLYQLKIYKKEPNLALDGGMNGLEIIDQLLYKAPQYLSSDGLILLEIETSQGESAKKLAETAFPNASIELFQDLAGHDRLISIQQGK